MPILVRLAEFLESTCRLAAARGSRVAALDAFLEAHGAAEAPGRAGLLPEPPREVPPELVSVVILTLNGAALLDALFRSIRRHNTWPDLEFIVVDHGGDAETAEVLEKASADFTIRHLVPGRNFSFAFSCNRAAQLARGNLLLFLNNDIEFTEDVIPHMAAAARATNGLIGLKLWRKSPEGHLAPEPQIGVRFRWNLPQRWTVPYETHPRREDALRAVAPARMPLVTAAIMACAREPFLALGGFCENYLYAYEDVDFGLKAAAAGMPSISLNHLSATHIVGATRFLRSGILRRRRWHGHNLPVFRARCGYRARRLAWSGLFGGEGFDWGRRPAAALLGAGPALPEISGPSPFAVLDDVADGPFGFGLYGYDLVISRDPAANLRRARSLSPMAVTVGWIGDAPGWEKAAHDYDLLVAADAETAAGLSRRWGRPVDVLPEGDWREAVVQLVRRFIAERHRVVLIGETESGEGDRLVSALRCRGFAVRREAMQSYPSQRAMRDDFAIWLSSPRRIGLPPDQCHISAFERGDGAFAGDIEMGSWKNDFDGWFQLLLDEMQGYHSARMAGPFDPPLAPAILPDDAEAPSFWAQFDDPTAWLIGRP